MQDKSAYQPCGEGRRRANVVEGNLYIQPCGRLAGRGCLGGQGGREEQGGAHGAKAHEQRQASEQRSARRRQPRPVRRNEQGITICGMHMVAERETQVAGGRSVSSVAVVCMAGGSPVMAGMCAAVGSAQLAVDDAEQRQGTKYQHRQQGGNRERSHLRSLAGE